jgi:hypothetical protein
MGESQVYVYPHAICCAGSSKVSDRYELVRELVRVGMTGNKINDILGGTRSDNLEMVRKAKAELGLVDAA